jgi:ketosteroid isomerase-like protein
MPGGGLEAVIGMYPPEGLDWAKLMSDPAAERRYRRVAEPLLAPDFELMPAQPAGSKEAVIIGVEAYIAAMRVVMEAFASFRITPESFVELEGRVMVFARLDGETAEGRYRFSGEGGALFDVEDGLIRRIREFDNRGDLLAAAGISPEEARLQAISVPDTAPDPR